MIEWFTNAILVISVLSAVLCVALGLAGRAPNDWTLGSMAVLTVLLIAQIAISIVAPLVGNTPTGSLLEYWVYLVSAAVLPVAAGFWALLERSRWSTVILGVAALSIAIMTYRMWQIWTVQVA